MLTAAMIRLRGFLNPRLGSLRERGICPPSKLGRTLCPERAFWPLAPFPAVPPCPDPSPLPTRFFFFREPSGGLNVARFIFRSPQLLPQPPGERPCGSCRVFQVCHSAQ